MKNNQLRAFHNVALCGGFSAAARHMGLTQPAISDQVRKLEVENDILLFHREARLVRLTQTGESLFRLTRKMFEIEGDIRDMLMHVRSELSGRLRIVADAVHHITPALTRFRARHPKVVVELTGGNSEVVLSRLNSYAAEIGVIGTDTPGREYISHDLGSSPIVAFASREFLDGAKAREAFREGVRLADIAHQPVVMREKGSKTRAHIEDAFAAAGLRVAPCVVVENREAMREVVAAGAGIGFVSSAEFGNDVRLTALPLRDTVRAMPEKLIYMRQRKDLRIIRAFRTCLEATQPAPQPNIKPE